MKIAVISPVYMAERSVDELVQRIIDALNGLNMDFEIILVEDGSTDKSWFKIEENSKKFKQVKGVKLSRNFGQHQAISAGLSIASGDYFVVLDCDLQDNPIFIHQMIEKAQQGFDIVYTSKKQRKHKWIKNLTASLFNWIFNFLLDNKELKASGKIGSFSLISKKVRDAYLSLNENRRHYLLILKWLGFNFCTIEIEAYERFEGKSSYSMKKLFHHAIDGIISQTEKPLRLIAGMGLFMSLFSLLSVFFISIVYCFEPFAALNLCLMLLFLFVSGLIIFSIGICGIYIGKTFEQSKQRPLFVVDKTVNLNT